MADDDGPPPYSDDLDSEEKQRDVWYKLRAIGGISTAVVVAFISILGSVYLKRQQDKSDTSHLYSQLMSEQQKAENEVRRDMFTQILSSFLKSEKNKSSECAHQRVERQLLELELISRNFHESLDLSPLFISLLLDIVRNVKKEMEMSPEQLLVVREHLVERLPFDKKKRDPVFNATAREKIVEDLRQRESLKRGEGENEFSEVECKYRTLRRMNREFRLQPGELSDGPELMQNIEQAQDKATQMVREGYRSKLIAIARRITNKQIESLNNVQQRLRLTVDLDKLCTKVRPNEYSKFSDDCEKEGYTAYLDIPIALDKETKPLYIESVETRKIAMHTNRAYPNWNQLRITVATSLSKAQLALDPQSEKCPEQFEEFAQSGLTKCDIRSFWVGFFDFPLVDNTYVSSEEKFAVILDSIDKEQAKLSLLYFPASYAVFKEKSYYQQRITQALMERLEE